MIVNVYERDGSFYWLDEIQVNEYGPYQTKRTAETALLEYSLYVLNSTSARTRQFHDFAILTEYHIQNYTIPQYGDAPDDEVEEWSAEQCVAAISKYVKRFRAGKRGRLETLRDMVKIAHFACFAFDKIGASDDEMEKIMRGKT